MSFILVSHEFVYMTSLVSRRLKINIVGKQISGKKK